MRFFTASVFAALAASVSAYTQPDYSQAPTGNPIYTPGLSQQVPVGSPFEITWDPTTPGTVSLVLLRGPSNDVQPLYPIAEKIANTGKFVWTPSTELQNDVTHYGLLLVDDATGQYQWSTQFGIKNTAAPEASSSSSSSSPSSSSSSSASVVESSTSAAAPSATETLVPIVATTTICPESETAQSSAATTPAFAAGTGSASVPVVSPTNTPYVPTTLSSVKPAASATAPPTFPGAADRNMVSFGGVAAIAGVAALLAF
jgi:hypothetical protein